MSKTCQQSHYLVILRVSLEGLLHAALVSLWGSNWSCLLCAACMRDTAAEKLEEQLRLRAFDYQLTDVSFRSFQVSFLPAPAAPEGNA